VDDGEREKGQRPAAPASSGRSLEVESVDESTEADESATAVEATEADESADESSEVDESPEAKTATGAKKATEVKQQPEPKPQPKGDKSVEVYERKKIVARRTIAWIFCGVLFALFPVWAEMFHQASDDGKIHWFILLRKGEQFVVGGVVSLAAVGEILTATVPEDEKNRILLLGLSAILAAIANILAYTSASNANGHFIVGMSLVLGIGTLIVGLICVRTAAGR
jgi:hypothetical protein